MAPHHNPAPASGFSWYSLQIQLECRYRIVVLFTIALALCEVISNATGPNNAESNLIICKPSSLVVLFSPVMMRDAVVAPTERRGAESQITVSSKAYC